jgi:hypothetical protein
MFGRRRVRNVVPGAVRHVPTSAELRTAGARGQEYAAWAQTNGFPLDGEARGYRARWRGRDVLVKPGLDGSAPIGVEAEFDVEHREDTVYLLSPKHPDAETELGKALAALLDGAEESALRSLSVTAEGLRFRFAPLTGPDTVQTVVEGAITIIADHVGRKGAPFR